MWLMTTFGFFSIIQKKPDDTLLTIRGSTRSDLEALRGRYLPSLSDIEEDPETDHKFRACASRKAVAQALSRIAMEIDYASFTEKRKELHGSRAARIQGGLWEVLWELRNGQSDPGGSPH
jgi:hypothetical protein